MSLHIIKTGICPPGTEPIVVIKEDDSILVSADQTFDLRCELRHTIANQGVWMLNLEV